MIRLLVESIAIQLEAAFGEDYTIYDESIEQGLKEPCFFIQCLESTSQRYRGKRFYRTHQFCIQYFPLDKINARTECEVIANRLYDALECLTLHDDQTKLWGKKMRHKIESGVLNFFVDFDLFILKETETPVMETLDHNMREKKGALPDGSEENHNAG